jgi:hypothetical protein
VRRESAEAVKYWWGVSGDTVALWRQALGVTRANNRGTRRLVRAGAARHGEACRGKPSSARPWTFGELALLGVLSDEALAARTGRSAAAVRAMRTRKGISPAEPPSL